MKRRKTLEVLLSRDLRQKPARELEAPPIWPSGMTANSALIWWAKIRQNAKRAPIAAKLGKTARPFLHRAGRARNFRLLARPGKDLAATDYPSGPNSSPCIGHKTTGAKPMKLETPMIILGQIQQVTQQTMTDKRDASKTSVMHLVVIADKTKPANFRCATPFCIFLPEERFRSQFGATDPIDELVTLAVAEIAPYNAFMKCKGQLVKGHVTGEQLTQLQAASAAAPAKPSGEDGPVREDVRKGR